MADPSTPYPAESQAARTRPASYRPASGTIPDAPGVYRFYDDHGRVLYVGKAKSLRSRLNSYFADPLTLHPRTQQLVTTASGVKWTVVNNEVEALQLEYSWIKEYDPRFNVQYRDDKSYPVLAVTLHEKYPRLHVYRGPRRNGVRYFGPYARAWAIRETLDLLLRVFPARTCSAGVFKRHAQLGRPCLLGYIGKCSAPCVGRVDAEQHREIVENFCQFLSGGTDQLLKQLERQMREAAGELDFERAARLRDDQEALKRALEKQAVVLPEDTDADVVAFCDDELAAAVQVFHIRGGRVRGQNGWVLDKAEHTTMNELTARFLTQFYGEQAGLADQADAGGSPVPREVLLAELPDEPETIQHWLSQLRGTKVALRVPQRGDKRSLLETVGRNAREAFQQYKLRRAGDLTARSQALRELQEALGLDQAPLRIECIDISHIQATDVVASMVVFEDGMARKSEYRRFSVRSGGEGGDVGSIQEVVQRRFARMEAERAERLAPPQPALGSGEEAAAQAPTSAGNMNGSKFAYPPNLLVIDGGVPQVNAAADVLAGMGITDVPVIGLAKRLEEIWLPADPDPILLPRTSEALYLLQRVRDEAHRFALTYHRSKRGKRMTTSALDSVPGLGQVRKKALLKHFGSVRKLKQATVDEIAAVPGMGDKTAQVVHAALAENEPDAPEPPSQGQAEEQGEHR